MAFFLSDLLIRPSPWKYMSKLPAPSNPDKILTPSVFWPGRSCPFRVSFPPAFREKGLSNKQAASYDSHALLKKKCIGKGRPLNESEVPES